MRAPLLALASRIGRNREVAGLHFPADTRASAVLAPKILDLLNNLDTFNAVLGKARASEWAGLVPAGRPNNVAPAEGLTDRIGDAVYRRLRANGDLR
jgi:hypothetical protein